MMKWWGRRWTPFIAVAPNLELVESCCLQMWETTSVICIIYIFVCRIANLALQLSSIFEYFPRNYNGVFFLQFMFVQFHVTFLFF